jgi:hypothetical protein
MNCGVISVLTEVASSVLTEGASCAATETTASTVTDWEREATLSEMERSGEFPLPMFNPVLIEGAKPGADTSTV